VTTTSRSSPAAIPSISELKQLPTGEPSLVVNCHTGTKPTDRMQCAHMNDVPYWLAKFEIRQIAIESEQEDSSFPCFLGYDA